MQAILFALVSFFGWGTGDVFGTIATRKIGAYSTTFWYPLFGIIAFSPIALFYVDNLNNLTLDVLLINIALGITSILGLLSFYQALRVGSAPLVGTLTASFVAITPIFSIIFFKEVLSNAQVVSIAVIFSGIIVSGFDLTQIKSKKVFKSMGILYSLIAAILFAIYWAFIKIPIAQIDWFWSSFIAAACFPFVLIPMRLSKIKLESPTKDGAFMPLVLNSILLNAGALSLNFAITKGLTAVVTPIAGAYPVLFAALSFWVFKDPIKKQEVAGIIITLVGIVALSLKSV